MMNQTSSKMLILDHPEYLIDNQTIYGPYQGMISIIFLNQSINNVTMKCYHPNQSKIAINSFMDQKFQLSTTTYHVNQQNNRSIIAAVTMLTIKNISNNDYGVYQCNNDRKFELTGRPKISLLKIDMGNMISWNVTSHTVIKSQRFIICLTGSGCRTISIRKPTLNDCSLNCQIIATADFSVIRNSHNKTIKLFLELTNRFGQTKSQPFQIPTTTLISEDDNNNSMFTSITDDNQIKLQLIWSSIIILILIIVGILACRQQQQQFDSNIDIDDVMITTTTSVTNLMNSIQKSARKTSYHQEESDRDDD